MFLKEFQKISPKVVSLVFGVLILCFALSFWVLAAWQEPTELPPGGNVDTPLNVGSDDQSKIGALTFPIFRDRDDANYYVDPAGAFSAILSGKVGIGVIAPNARLQINGSISRQGTTLSGSDQAKTTQVNLGVNSQTVGDNSTVSGGYENEASASGSTVSGGCYNISSSDRSTIGGGRLNTASGEDSTIGGGYNNTASGDGSTIGGGYNNTSSNSAATIGGGKDNKALASYSTIGGGRLNTVSANDSIIGGGYNNTASGWRSTVSGGENNAAGNSLDTVGGGSNNIVSGGDSVISGGCDNEASGPYSTIGGGYNNTASDDGSTIGGGYNNTATGQYSTVSGGANNVATGEYSFAAGRRAKADHNGSFVWADYQDIDYSSNGVNTFNISAQGGVYIDGGDLDLGGNDIVNCGISDCGDYIFRNQETKEKVWTLKEGKNDELEFYNKDGIRIMWLDQDGALHVKKIVEEEL